MIVVSIVIFAIIGWADLPKILREKQWKELVLYALLLLTGFVGVTLYLYQIPLPSPVRGIWRFIRDVLGIGYSP
jgi:hypothetical protein